MDADAVHVSEVVRNYAIVAGGFIGIAIAYWRARASNRQAEASVSQAKTANRDHITDVFSRAVGLLAAERLEVRLGAIYTLRRIAEDFPDFSSTIIDLLSAYVRERSQEYEGDAMPVDIEEIVTFLRRSLREDA